MKVSLTLPILAIGLLACAATDTEPNSGAAEDPIVVPAALESHFPDEDVVARGRLVAAGDTIDLLLRLAPSLSGTITRGSAQDWSFEPVVEYGLLAVNRSDTEMHIPLSRIAMIIDGDSVVTYTPFDNESLPSFDPAGTSRMVYVVDAENIVTDVSTERRGNAIVGKRGSAISRIFLPTPGYSHEDSQVVVWAAVERLYVPVYARGERHVVILEKTRADAPTHYINHRELECRRKHRVTPNCLEQYPDF
jgi:hypothetical protein